MCWGLGTVRPPPVRPHLPRPCPRRWAGHVHGPEWMASWLTGPCWPSAWRVGPGLWGRKPDSHLSQTTLAFSPFEKAVEGRA